MMTWPSNAFNAVERTIREAIPKVAVEIYESAYDGKIRIAASRRLTLPKGKLKSITRTVYRSRINDEELLLRATHAIIRELTQRKPRPGVSRSYVRQGRQPRALL